jgi:hypothetical protein
MFPNLLVLVLPHIKLTDWSYSLLTLHQVSFKLLLSVITLGKHIEAILQFRLDDSSVAELDIWGFSDDWADDSRRK